MPQRLLKPTLRQSERWNRLPYFEQVFFIRLLMLVDDYGRYEAHPMLLANEAFPYGDPSGLSVNPQSIDRALLTLASKECDLIQLYHHENKRYLQLNRWKERVRTESKYPMPAECGQMTATCGQMLASPPSPTPTPLPSPAPPPSPQGADTQSKFPSLEDVKAHAVFIGCLPEEAEKFWHHFDSSGWIDKNGHAIRNWKSKLQTWAATARSSPAEAAHRRNEGRFDKPQKPGFVATEIAALRKELEKL